MFLPQQIQERTRGFLMDLIRIPSTRGNEGPASHFVHEQIAPFVDHCDLVYISDYIMQDPDYAFPLQGHTYKNTPNVECVIHGKRSGPAIVFNTHLDVVPPSEGQENAFDPYEEDSSIFGRGACDDKGQVAVLYALAQMIREKGIQPEVDLIFHFVIEEENGGNGTLAMVRRGVQAGAAIVLEASDMAIYPAVRGAVWFQLKTFGRAGHSGNIIGRISALDKAIQAMEIFKRYHDQLLSESRQVPLFEDFLDPMPLTFGQCNAGNWPASVPAEATLKGVLGFLPNKNRKEVQEGLRKAILRESDKWLRDNFELTFPMLNSDGNSIPANHPLVTSLAEVVHDNGVPVKVSAMTGSCDAWLYNNQAGIPTVVFGPGELRYAHSKDEHIHLQDIFKTSEILFDFVQVYKPRQSMIPTVDP